VSGIGKFLGSISPAFGLASGQGLFGDIGPAIAGMGGFGLAGLLAKLLGKHDDGGTQSAPVAAETPVNPTATGIPGMDDINASLARNAALGQQNGNGMNAARFAMSSGDSMAGLGAGLGSLLSRIGMRL
jgi:hypothetical protein